MGNIVIPSQNDFCIANINCQTKLMGEHASIYSTNGFKMPDGTHKITKYNMTFIFWMVDDCLLRSKFVGYTANFTENSKVIIDGAEVFFNQEVSRKSPSQGDDNNICVGGIPGYFDPFVDNEINFDEVCNNNGPSGDLSDVQPVCSLDGPPGALLMGQPVDLSNEFQGGTLNENPKPISSISTKFQVDAGFMTDEGSAFPIVAERFGWTHLLDWRHFATQILSAWHCLPDPHQFQSDVYNILDSPSVDTMESLLERALSKYCTDKAQVLLNKISQKKRQLCYAYTCKTFTAGQVSDQRIEQGMATIKANRKLKKFLHGCTYGKAVSRISQIARDQDIATLTKLQSCREDHKKVGWRYTKALNNSKIAAMKYSCVERINPSHPTQMVAKETDPSNVRACNVNLSSEILWRGRHY